MPFPSLPTPAARSWAWHWENDELLHPSSKWPSCCGPRSKASKATGVSQDFFKSASIPRIACAKSRPQCHNTPFTWPRASLSVSPIPKPVIPPHRQHAEHSRGPDSSREPSVPSSHPHSCQPAASSWCKLRLEIHSQHTLTRSQHLSSPFKLESCLVSATCWPAAGSQAPRAGEDYRYNQRQVCLLEHPSTRSCGQANSTNPCDSTPLLSWRKKTSWQ